VVSFSNRCSPNKALAIWQALSGPNQHRLVGVYMRAAGFRQGSGGGRAREKVIRLPRPSQAAARPHVRAAHDEFGHPRTAVAAAPFHLHPRHVAVAGVDQRGEIRVLGVVGRLAIRAPALHCRTQAGEAYGSQTLLRGPQQRVGTRSSRSISASTTQSLAISSDTSIPACCSMVVPSMMLEQASA
jgi:hypothetical protein